MASIAQNLADTIDLADDKTPLWPMIIQAAWVRLFTNEELWFVFVDYSVLTISKSEMSIGEIPREDFQNFLITAVNQLSTPLIRDYARRMMRSQ